MRASSIARAAPRRSPSRLERVDRLLQRVLRFAVASRLRGGLAEPGQRSGPFGVSFGGERERPLEARERGGGVEPEGAFPGERRGTGARVLAARRPGRRCPRRGRGRVLRRSGRRARRRGLRPGRVPSTRSTWRRRHGGRRGMRAGAGCRRRRGRARARTRTPPPPPSTTAGRAGRAPCGTSSRSASVTVVRGRGRPSPRRHRPRRPCRSPPRPASSDFALRLQGVQPGGDQRLHRVGERHLGPAPQLPARRPRSSRSRSRSSRTNSSA